MKKHSVSINTDLLVYFLIVTGSILFSSLNYFFSFFLWNSYGSSPFLDFIQLFLLSLSFSFSLTSFFTALYIGYTNKKVITSIVIFLSLVIISFIAQFIVLPIFMDGSLWNEAPFLARFSPFSIVPYGLIGYSIGIFIFHIKNKQKIKLNLLPHALFITVLFALLVAFIGGFFGQDPLVENYTGNYHYFLNRGVPFVFNGFSDKNAPIQLWMIKSPLETNLNAAYIKIIDLIGLLKNIGFYSLFAFLPSLFFVQQQFKKDHLIIWSLLYIFMFIVTFFVWNKII